MNADRELPIAKRHGKRAWLGPVSLLLALINWFLPAGNLPVAVGAVLCGAASMSTSTEYRLDWTALVGTAVGAASGVVAVLMLAITKSGY